jgi:putative PEP-CTERM system histidine kinase
MTINIDQISIGYSLVALLCVAYFLFALFRPALHGKQRNAVLAVFFVMFVWSLMTSFAPAFFGLKSMAIVVSDLGKDLVWVVFLRRLILAQEKGGQYERGLKRIVFILFGGVVIAIAADMVGQFQEDKWYAAGYSYSAMIVLSAVGLMFAEQLVRNFNQDRTWYAKSFCIGVGGLFVYDFLLYSSALLYSNIDTGLWQVRGWLNVLIVVLVILSIRHYSVYDIRFRISRQVMFYMAMLTGAVVALVMLAIGGLYLKQYGKFEQNITVLAFLAAGVGFILVFIYSQELRAKLKVFLSLHFYTHKYDYRDEWIKFIRTLTMGDDDVHIHYRVIKSVADIVKSNEGSLWLRRDNAFVPASSMGIKFASNAHEPVGSGFIEFLEKWQWVINVDEYQTTPDLYSGMELPNWLLSCKKCWLVVPVMLQHKLIGFIVVGRSYGGRHFNWEDIDVLKISGRQVASYLALLDTTEQLMDARQFEAFNRLSAFVVHDLKNVVAQLSLVVSNSKRHRDNPEFFDDVIRTVDNAVSRMNKTLANLRDSSIKKSVRVVSLQSVIKEAVDSCFARAPSPVLHMCEKEMYVKLDDEQLKMVIAHIIHNAQDATPDDGRVLVEVKEGDGGMAVIKVLDNGYGMEDQFVKERLFRPFDTTKGNAGMGIGAYQAREFVRDAGGEINVKSRVGIGTDFEIRIPFYFAQNDALEVTGYVK